ncbi:hypothetical protein Bbelb_384500 [Branchiostoma belcheri]|nr:hypothetical protein Bbelb_384500 [Branchiostoma belcheri]
MVTSQMDSVIDETFVQTVSALFSRGSYGVAGGVCLGQGGGVVGQLFAFPAPRPREFYPQKSGSHLLQLSKRLKEAELAFRTSGVISEIHCAINLPAGLCVQLPTPCLGDKWSGWVLNRPRSLAVPLCLPLIGHGSNVDHVEDCSLYEASGSGWTEKKSAKETDDMPGVLVRAERTVCRSGPLSADQLPWLYIICLFLL